MERHSCGAYHHRVFIAASLGNPPRICEKPRPIDGRSLWGKVYIDDRTIDSHVKRLRKKKRVADESFTAIETLYGIGYRYNDTW